MTIEEITMFTPDASADPQDSAVPPVHVEPSDVQLGVAAEESATVLSVAEEETFAEMFAAHEREETPQSHLIPGQRVSARIVAITTDTVFVSTGSKVDGIVDREELEVDGELSCNVDDVIDLYVVTVNPQEVKLSKVIRGAGGLAALEEARDARLPVEGKVTAQVKGGYAIEVMKRRAFCPVSQMDLRALTDLEAPLGKTFSFVITKLEKGGRNIVLSRRVLLEREQAENRDALLATLNVGDVREAPVTRVAPFGAFVELAPGVEGLVHVSELSWARVAQADEAVSVGDVVRVKITAIEQNEKGVRISLSARQVTEDPWTDVEQRIQAGDVVQGKVIRTAQFGAFIEILPGIEGLAHLSELSYERRVNKVEDVLVAGDRVSVKVKEIDVAKKRISLSVRDAAGNPWESLPETVVVDGELTGTVEKRAPFGLFITLAPGVTGLMPNSVIQQAKDRRSLEKLGAGDSVAVRVKELDLQNRRISLAPAGEQNNPEAVEEKDWKRHAAPKQSAPAGGGMGTLGMALQTALKKKK